MKDVTLQQAPAARTAADALAGTEPRFEGAYVHVPFCFHKCHYCDFYSFVDREDRQDAYAARIDAELAAMARFVRAPLRTLAAVRAIAPVAGRPPKRALPIFANP